MGNITGIKQVDLSKIEQPKFKQQYADCVILTYNRKILLQHRPDNWRTSPGMITTFGGHIETHETPTQAVIRELQEEVGAKVTVDKLLTLGTITEECTQHTELVHLFFWHDKHNTITGCYECEAQYFDNVVEALAHPKLMEYVHWVLVECQNRELLDGLYTR